MSEGEKIPAYPDEVNEGILRLLCGSLDKMVDAVCDKVHPIKLSNGLVINAYLCNLVETSINGSDSSLQEQRDALVEGLDKVFENVKEQLANGQIPSSHPLARQGDGSGAAGKGES